MRKLAYRLHQDVPDLRDWDQDDLVQEALLKAMIRLDDFRGESSLKTWVISLARNHLITMARHLSHRPRAVGDAVYTRPVVAEPHRQVDLREQTKGLLGWLRQSPDGVKHGWEVLNLLLKNHGNFHATATAMSVYSGSPWTVERTRNVVRQIKATAKGQALCEAVGIVTEGENNTKE